ncbi:AraC family transcriptional regulator [Paenibacillus eucommiae]|uniref:AraC-like DNA-binding protein n=1 Tax=Paenibacillus eucommiae TaxID=1355755 RepID=A0ABS4J0D4_9BACL|nr:AraC family transcriptional regulator [Paenibacillus eucommiae]MBP1993303.1 AraC-like DNA-binding protein [Paenibacillus eucommiae]
MKKRWFNRLLLSYLPVLFVVSLSILLITYLTLSQVSKRAAHNASKVLSYTIMQSLDNILENIESMTVKEILENDLLKQFFQRDKQNYSPNDDYRAAAVLNELMERNAFIHSIYLLRTTESLVLTPTSLTKLNEFGDRTFVSTQISTKSPFKWQERRIYQTSLGDSKGTEVITLVKFANLSDRSLIVVNVSTAKLSEWIRTMSDARMYFVDLIDQDGQLITSNRNVNLTAGDEAAPSNGKEWSRVQSTYTNWSIRTGSDGTGVVEWVSSLFYIWIGLGFMILAGGIIWLVYISRRNYRPFVSMASKISAYAEEHRQELKTRDSMDELKFIEHAMEDLMAYSSDLQQQNLTNIGYRKKHTFLSLVEGIPDHRTEQIKEELREYGFVFPTDHIAVTVLEIDCFSSFSNRYSHRDQQLLKHVVASAAQEMADQQHIPIWCEWLDHHRLACLYFLEDEAALSLSAEKSDSRRIEDESSQSSPDFLGERISPLADKIREWVQDNMSFTVTVSMADQAAGLTHIAPAARQVILGLECKISLGVNRVIDMRQRANWKTSENFHHQQSIRMLCQKFRAGESEWEIQYADLADTLSLYVFNRSSIESLFDYFVYYLDKEMQDLPAEFRDPWGDVHAQLKQVVQSEETLDQICLRFGNILEKAALQMNELRASKNNHQLIKQVKSYISEHFANPELSLNHLNGEFGMNASYLSRLFKEEFGVKFIDYVSQVRIEQAIVILQKNESITNQELAEEVGYSNAITFTRAFKKYTGSTPGQYRKPQ